MAVTIDHNINLAGLSELASKLDQMVHAINNSFSQFADSLDKLSGTSLNSQISVSAKATTQSTKFFDTSDLIKSNDQLTKMIGKLDKNFSSFVNLIPKNPIEQNSETQQDKNNRKLAMAIGGIVGGTLIKLGSQYENLGTTIGQQFQAINQSAFNSKQFVQAQISNQLNNEYGMAKTAVTGGASAIGTFAGARLGAAAGSILGIPGMVAGGAIGGIAGFLGASGINYELNKDLEQKKASSQFGLNALDQAYYLNLSQSRFGNAVALTGRSLTLPQFEDVTGAKVGGIKANLTGLQEQLIKEKSPFLNNAYDILNNITGSTKGIDVHSFVNNIGKAALMTGLPEGQIGAFAGQVAGISQISDNKDIKGMISKITENQIKYGGDTVQNLQLVKQVMTTTGTTDFNKAMDFVYRSQLNPTMMQASMNWQSQTPLNRFQIQTMGKIMGLNPDQAFKEGHFSTEAIKRIGDISNPNKIPTPTQVVAGMIATSMGTTLQAMMNPNNRMMSLDTSKVAGINDMPVAGAPSMQEFLQSFTNALSNLTTLNATATTINITGNTNGNNFLSMLNNPKLDLLPTGYSGGTGV